MLRKILLQKKKEEPSEEELAAVVIDLNMLEEHLERIKVSLLEIRAFRKKKIVKSPTFHFMQKIDIEEAWPGCRDTLRQAYDLLCNLAENLNVQYETAQSTATFGMSIDQFVNLIDRIMIFLEDAGEKAFSETNLQSIDAAILKVQQCTNRLQKHVMVDFVFTRNM